jgi:cystathionine beta-lyase
MTTLAAAIRRAACWRQQLAALENGTQAYCFTSGMAAITNVARLLRTGDEIVSDSDLYGGTCRLFSKVLERTGISVHYGDASDLESFAAKITPRTKLVYIESPTNPLLRIIDIAAVARIAHAAGAWLCVDNSLMSPYLQNPLDLGADFVIHSGTKFLCGHSDVTGGAVIVKDPALAEQVRFLQNAEGSALGPFDCFLLLRGLKTLKLRVDAQQHNAAAVARFLRQDPRITEVYYPGLVDSPGYKLQHAQARGAGSVLSFTTGSVEVSKALAEAAQLFHICVSFGSINSTISLPGCMSHASVPPEIAVTRSLPPDLVRISVGIEDPGDLVADLSDALSKASPAGIERSLGSEQAAVQEIL